MIAGLNRFLASFKKNKEFFRIQKTPGYWIVGFGILVILTTCFITVMIIFEDRRLEMLRTRQETENLSVILERHIHETFFRIESSLYSLRNRFKSGTGNDEMHLLINNHMAANPDLYNLISIIDADGNVILTDKKQFKPTYSGDRPFFIYHKEKDTDDNLHIWPPTLGRVTGKWYIPVSLRLQNSRGEFTGVLLASINPEYFSIIFHEARLGNESFVYLADFNGIIYSGILGGKDIGLDKIIPEDKLAEILNVNKRYSGTDSSEPDGVLRIYSRTFISKRSMFVSVGVSLNECLASWRKRLPYLIVIQVSISIIILLFIIRLRQAIISRDTINAELDQFFLTSLDLLCIIDSEGKFRRVNREWENVLGYSAEELKTRNFLEFVHPDDMQSTIDMEKLSKTQKIFNFINRYRCGDGSYRYIEWRSSPHGDLIYAAARDITEQRKGEEALRESEEKLKAIFNAVNIAFGITDVEGRYVIYNKRMADITGYDFEELKQKTILDLTFPEDVAVSREYFMKVIDGELNDYRLEKRYIRRDGQIIWCDISVSPVKDRDGKVLLMAGVVNDITEQKEAGKEREKLQAQLNQSQKMESVGRLAGGVAHDFNNMLGAIFGYTELSLRKLPPEHPAYAYLQEIKKAAGRSADLTSQLLAFARRQTVVPKILDLNQTLEGMLKMLRQIIGEDISLEWLPYPSPVVVKMDPTQVDQILVNLCVNARDAITDTGRIIIETGKAYFDGIYSSTQEVVAEGDYVLLTVKDNGKGMDKETLEHLFEPFFTTKKTGKGTGLGLATVYGIVKQNNGFINVYSEPETGTTFRIYLPRHYEAPDTKDPTVTETRPDIGHETILLVEDETMLLDINREILEQLGYKILAADSPVEAVRIAEDYTGKIDLLITDVIMPGMNGRDLAGKISSLYPDIKLLFMSGYTDSVIARHGILDNGIHFIMKPFSINDLADKVKETLREKT